MREERRPATGRNVGHLEKYSNSHKDALVRKLVCPHRSVKLANETRTGWETEGLKSAARWAEVLLQTHRTFAKQNPQRGTILTNRHAHGCG